MPPSVIVAVIALGSMLTLDAFLGMLIVFVQPEESWRSLLGLMLGGLVMWGLVVGHRLAWQWGRILGLLSAIMLTILVVAVAANKVPSNEPGWVVVVQTMLFAFMAACLWTIFFALGRPGAREHFRLRCPSCNQLTNQAADFFFNRAKCRSCKHIWS